MIIKFSRKNISYPLFIEWPEESIHAKELAQFPLKRKFNCTCEKGSLHKLTKFVNHSVNVYS